MKENNILDIRRQNEISHLHRCTNYDGIDCHFFINFLYGSKFLKGQVYLLRVVSKISGMFQIAFRLRPLLGNVGAIKSDWKIRIIPFCVIIGILGQ